VSKYDDLHSLKMSQNDGVANLLIARSAVPGNQLLQEMSINGTTAQIGLRRFHAPEIVRTRNACHRDYFRFPDSMHPARIPGTTDYGLLRQMAFTKARAR
jgi:hypothetical protein